MREGVWLRGGQLSRSGPALVLRELLVLPMKQLPTVLRVHPGQHWKEPHLSTNSEYLGFEVKFPRSPPTRTTQCPGTEVGTAVLEC